MCFECLLRMKNRPQNGIPWTANSQSHSDLRLFGIFFLCLFIDQTRRQISTNPFEIETMQMIDIWIDSQFFVLTEKSYTEKGLQCTNSFVSFILILQSFSTNEEDSNRRRRMYILLLSKNNVNVSVHIDTINHCTCSCMCVCL